MAYQLMSLIDGLKAPTWDVPEGDPVPIRSRKYGGRDDLHKWPWPKRLIMSREPKSKLDDGALYDMMETAGQKIVVSQKARDLIEKFEPGVHSFPSVLFLDRSGKPIDAAYFWLDVGQAFDAINRSNSDDMAWFGLERGGRARPPMAVKGPYGHIMSSQKIAGRHLWAGNIVDGESIFLSGALTREMKSLLKMDHYFKQISEVDMLWSIETDLPELLDYASRNPDAREATLTEEWLR